MPQDDLHLLDESLEEANKWLREISDEMGGVDRQTAYHALRGVLFTLRDRMTVEETTNLSAQLPMLIRGIYFEGYRSAHKPIVFREKAEFTERVNRELSLASAESRSDEAIRAVLTVLSLHLSDGQVQQIFEMMPEEVRELWPEEII